LHWFWIGFLGLAALIWFTQSIDLAFGALSIPALKNVAPLNDTNCPSVSILFAARDEAEQLPAALETFLALDYPKYEVIAVNDRSVDAT
jgi:cellulose synthase/poly-beta-1,6-N-acetylglucosamine synthase-like glycosyltransferase